MTYYRKGEQVQYLNNGPVPSHQGRVGAVTKVYRRGGWVGVDFGNGVEAKCDPQFLQVTGLTNSRTWGAAVPRNG
jgi:hypothetical protein